MANQTNNLLLLDKTVGSAYYGMSRTLSTNIGDPDVLQVGVDLELSGDFTFTGDNFDIEVPGICELSTGGSTLDIQGPDINIGTTSVGDEANTNVDIGSSGTTMTLTVIDNTASAFTLAEGANEYLSIDTLNGSETLTLDSPGRVLAASEFMFDSSPVGIKVEASEALSAGDVLTLDGSTNPTSALIPLVKKAAANAATESERVFSGVVTSASISSSANGFAATVAGTVVAINFVNSDLPGAGDVGKPVFISTTAGKAGMTAPNVSGQTVFQIGFLISETAVSGTLYAVLLSQQLIGVIP